jgi:hypothetical protein
MPMSQNQGPPSEHADEHREKKKRNAKRGCIGCLGLVVVLAIIGGIIGAQDNGNEPNTIQRGPSRPTNLSSYEKSYLTSMYNELNDIVATSSFEYYGFAPGGPHHDWLEEMEEWREGDRSFWGGTIATELIQLAMAYVHDNQENIQWLDSCVVAEIDKYSS